MFELPKLDYSNSALSPIMSEQTLDLHHRKHHQTYISNLNNFIKGSEYEKLSLEDIIKKNDLKLEKINTYSHDYARTLATWRKNFLSAWEKISPLGFDEFFKRMWEFYLSYCEGGFKSRNINLIQFSMSNRYSS